MRWPLFRGNWWSAVFIHYEVEPRALQRCVPFELDLREGRAYASLVAFTLRRMRPGLSGRVGEMLLRPLSEHGLLNLRTYVRVGGETGIYFLAEWLPNRLALPLGRPFFGLPYHFGQLAYRHDPESGSISGEARSRRGVLRYRGEFADAAGFAPCDPDSRGEFLLERYTAFTEWRGLRRFFRVWHQPWLLRPVELKVSDDSLLQTTGNWHRYARMIGAQYSPGVEDVWMGQPQLLQSA